jgi:DNA-binding IclR family transcriptional regulator
MNPKDRYLINSIMRACALLKCFSKKDSSYKPSELANLLKIDRSTVYRILLSLEKCGMVEKNAETGKYSLGVAVLQMGTIYLHSTGLFTVAHPLMIELVDRTKETVHLTILRGDRALYIDKIDSPRSLTMSSEIGNSLPLYLTGVGKVLLAYQSSQKIKQYIDTYELVGVTKNTITSKIRLMEELNKIRDKGFAEDNRESSEEVGCVAVPIFNHHQNIIAALSVSGPYQRILLPGVKKTMIMEAKAVAAQISEKMGHQNKLEPEWGE